ncbi:hypothetical protein RRG08_049682 [Elysia crispata]|uniref:CCHC-type domain-containing protein n=1 Tax=Elysia crispata TaxID=231223 RepID=A0AAE0ZWL7_9GAST|nr:hypothetical protein RRG08_049682 [Elysia crispata]
MSIAALGRIEEFDPAQNDLESYLEQLEQYFVANDVTEAKRTAVLLSVTGAKTYEVLKSLIASDKPSANIKIQQRLLQTERLTRKKALDIAQTMENAEMNAKELHDQFTSKVHTVDKIESRGSPKIKAVPRQSQGKTPSRPTATPTANKKQCYRCGYTTHPAERCRYKDYICNDCHKKGHLAKVCRSRGRQHQTTKQIVDEEEDYIFHNSSRDGRKAFYIMMNLNGKDVKMEIDTGSGVTIMPDSVFQETFKNEVELQTSTQILKTYNGSNIPLKGEAMMDVRGKEGRPRKLRLLVAQVPHQSPVPYAVKAKVEEELRKLEKENIITKVTHSEWAAPLVVVPKENGNVRLCGNFKVIINGEMKALREFKGVQVFIDDIRLTGDSDEQNLERLDKVLEALENNGVKLNKDKCSFMQEAINYLGHTIDADGLHPQEDKVKAMQNFSRPENVKELRSFLGGVQYYGKLLPNLSATLKSLNDLLKKDQEWKWTEECEASFQKVKDMLGSKTVLTHYDPSLPVFLATDASTKGLGVVLSHRMPNREEGPIAYASRSLTKAETNYAQIEKEALSIIIDIQYKRSEDHNNADMLSRLPEAQQQQQHPKQETVYFSYINEMPVSAADIAAET